MKRMVVLLALTGFLCGAQCTVPLVYPRLQQQVSALPVVADKNGVLWIPDSFLYPGSTDCWVYVCCEGKAMRRWVWTGEQRHGMTALRFGASAGELLLCGSQGEPENGMWIRI